MFSLHDDVIKWKHFPRYWPFARGIHRSPVNSTHKGQWRGALMFSLICARINGWVNNRETGDLRRHQAHCDVIVMIIDPVWGESIDHQSGCMGTFCSRKPLENFRLRSVDVFVSVYEITHYVDPVFMCYAWFAPDARRPRQSVMTYARQQPTLELYWLAIDLN